MKGIQDSGWSEAFRRVLLAETRVTVGIHEKDGPRRKIKVSKFRKDSTEWQRRMNISAAWTRRFQKLAASGVLTKAQMRSKKGNVLVPNDKLTNAEIGFIHEYGKGHNPQRSFLRSTFDEKYRDYVDYFGRFYAAAVRGRIPMDRVPHFMGLKAVADVKRKIRAQIPPPLADATIERKGSSTPLIDRGELINAIDYEVSASQMVSAP